MKKCILIITVFLIHSYVFCGTKKIESGTKDTILNYGKEWKQNYDRFIPDIELLTILKEKTNNNLKIDIYLGLWCGDSENNVPKFIKILDALKKKIEVNYYLCERKKDKSVKFFVEDKQIIRVPTFIFYKDKKEIGRIIENPNKSLIEDFLEIVF